MQKHAATFDCAGPQVIKAPSIFQQAATLFTPSLDAVELRKQGNELATRISQLNSIIATNAAEIAAVRAECERLRSIVSEARTSPAAHCDAVALRVASLGFPASQLPSSSPIERAADGIEDLKVRMAEEADPVVRAQIAGKILDIQRKRRG